MMKKIIIILSILILTTGCEKKEGNNYNATLSTGVVTTGEMEVVETETTTEVVSSETTELTTEAEPVRLVSAEEFMTHYSLTEDQVPMEYVMGFIDEYDLTVEDLDRPRLGKIVLEDYQNGYLYGHNLNRIFDGPESEEALDKYIEKMEVLYIRFDRYYGEYFSREHMVIDLKEKKIYYSELDVQDYTSYDMSADLSDEDVESIREELPKHIDESIGYSKPEVYGEYSFGIFMNATDDTTKAYYGDIGEPEAFPGFDEYWRGLYKKYFGKEYKFESYYYNLYN